MKTSPKNKLLTVQIAQNKLQEERENHVNRSRFTTINYFDGSSFTAIEDEAATVLATFEADSLNLDGLVSLSVPAAEALAKFKGSYMSLNGITNLPPLAASALAKYRGENLTLMALQLTAEVSTQFAGYKGHLALGITVLDMALIETFHAYKGHVWIGEVTRLGDEEAAKLAGLISTRKVTSYLGAVREFTDCDGHLALLGALVKVSTQKGSLLLGRTQQVAPRALQVLAEFEGGT